MVPVPYVLSSVGVFLVALGLWLLRGHLKSIFYRRYEPRPMLRLVTIGLGILVCVAAFTSR